MKLAHVCLALLASAMACETATAQTYDVDNNDLRGVRMFARSGLRDIADIPAPIPVPAANPVPEGFSYYLRLDMAYGLNARQPSFAEAGRAYGSGGAGSFNSASSFAYGGAPFSSVLTNTEDSYAGGIGFGAYFTPTLRGDFTLELRGDRNSTTEGVYSYTSTGGGNPTITGWVQDTIELRTTVGMINGYMDLLPRGGFTPYVGAGVGLAYNQLTRKYVNTETGGGATQSVSGTGTDVKLGFAGALMGGVTFAFDHSWAIDLNYRALYLQGGNVALTTTGLATNQRSTVTLGDTWEHQVRIGLRFNIW